MRDTERRFGSYNLRRHSIRDVDVYSGESLTGTGAGEAAKCSAMGDGEAVDFIEELETGLEGRGGLPNSAFSLSSHLPA